MKLVMRKWRWLTGLLAAGLICATYLLAQPQNPPANSNANDAGATKTLPPTVQESADCERLVRAINGGDAETALEILHGYGIADDTLLDMATRLGKPAPPVVLPEPFLRASVAALALTDRLLKANIQYTLAGAIATTDYEQPVWMPRRPDTWATASYDVDLLQCPVAPIMVLNIRLDDPCLIRYFKLYDRYADNVHSVVLNGPNLSNAKLDETNYYQASLTLNALFQLIKARNTKAFVWLSVVKQDNHSDEQWLKAMTFAPDGLQISNLRQFHSPFAETHTRYAAIVGPDMPMMVSGFEGYTAALREQAQMLDSALKSNNVPAEAAATAHLGGVGEAVGENLAEVETNLQSLGYRGISVEWSLLSALANSTNAAPADKSDLIDPNAGLLDIYFGKKDYANVLAFAGNMVSSAAPGDLNWAVGKLYQGIALLSQSPPDTSDGINVLNQILAFNFKNRPGRDHYILGAVKWRIYAARLSGDTQTPPQLVQWVQNQSLRADLKGAFLKEYGDYLTSSKGGSK